MKKIVMSMFVVILIITLIGCEKLSKKPDMYIETAQRGRVLTVQDAIIGKDSALIHVDFRKEDGTAFEEGLEDYEVRWDSKESRAGSAYMQLGISSDHKVIEAVIDLDYEELLEMQKVRVSIQELGQEDKVPWEVEIPLKLNYQTQKVKVNYTIKEDYLDVKIQSLEISPLRIRIEGEKTKESQNLILQGEKKNYLKLKDGSITELYVSDLRGIFEKKFSYSLVPRKDEDTDKIDRPIIFDIEKMESLVIGEYEIPIR